MMNHMDYKAEKIMKNMVTHGLAVAAGIYIAPFFLALAFIAFAGGSAVWYLTTRYRFHRKQREQEITDRLVRMALADLGVNTAVRHAPTLETHPLPRCPGDN
jgi:hypothetical protein